MLISSFKPPFKHKYPFSVLISSHSKHKCPLSVLITSSQLHYKHKNTLPVLFHAPPLPLPTKGEAGEHRRGCDEGVTKVWRRCGEGVTKVWRGCDEGSVKNGRNKPGGEYPRRRNIGLDLGVAVGITRKQALLRPRRRKDRVNLGVEEMLGCYYTPTPRERSRHWRG